MRARQVFELAQDLKDPYEYKEIDPNSVRPPYHTDNKYFKVYRFYSDNKTTGKKDEYTVYTFRIKTVFAPWVADISKLEIPKREFNGFEMYFETNDDREALLTGGMDVFRVMSTVVSIGKSIVKNHDMDFMMVIPKQEKENDRRRLNIYKKYLNEQMKDWAFREFVTEGNPFIKLFACKKIYEKYFVSFLYKKEDPLFDPIYKGANWETKARF